MTFFGLIGVLVFTGLAQGGTPVEKQVPVEKVYVPTGFDSNDNVEIVVTGFLPNLCHKSPASKATIKDKQIKVEVTSLYYQESNPFCPEMVVPFVETITLGVMDAGKYEIVVNEKGQSERKEEITITETGISAVDNFNYAYVEYIEKEAGGNIVFLKGYNPSDCFVLDKIEHFSNGKDTYSILPKMRQVTSFCPMKMTPFSLEYEVPSELEAKRILLHVRTLNGKSVNIIFTNPR